MSYKYHSNRSVFLDEVLEKRGWIRATAEEKADFGMWATHNDRDRDSAIKLYEKSKTDQMDNKRYFYKHLLEKELLDNIPETYLTWGEIVEARDSGKFHDENGKEDGRLWFLKHATSTEGKHVWCYHNLKELEVFATRNGIMNSYVVQREVDKMKLLVGYKVTFRIYVLIWEGKMYIYKTYTGKFHPRPYNRVSLERDVHVECAATGVVFPFRGDTWEEVHSASFEEIKEVCRTVVGSFIPKLVEDSDKDINAHQKDGSYAAHTNKYSLLGLDFIIDQDYKPWLIEINTYPFLWDQNPLVIGIKKKLLNDLFDFVINPRTTGIDVQMGDFEEL